MLQCNQIMELMMQKLGIPTTMTDVPKVRMFDILTSPIVVIQLHTSNKVFYLQRLPPILLNQTFNLWCVFGTWWEGSRWERDQIWSSSLKTKIISQLLELPTPKIQIFPLVLLIFLLIRMVMLVSLLLQTSPFNFSIECNYKGQYLAEVHSKTFNWEVADNTSGFGMLTDAFGGASDLEIKFSAGGSICSI